MHHLSAEELKKETLSADNILKKDLKYIQHCLSQELKELEGKRVLITGGGGFLGYYLVQCLLFWNQSTKASRKIDVTVYDNYARGLPAWLTSLQSDPCLHLVNQDMCSPLPENVPEFAYILHAASIASPTYYRKYPIQTMDVNVNGLRSLLEYARYLQEKGILVQGLVFFSSSEIYGDPSQENIPTPETYLGNVSCTGPRACYDESKRYGEALCVNFAKQHELKVKVVRPFNNYGPGLKITDKRVIPDFARNIFAGRDIVMHSDGSPTRTFCYVADAVVGYYKVLINGKPGEAYNIGADSPEISIFQLARLMVEIARQLLGYQGQILCEASKEAEYLVDSPNRRCPAIEKAREELGYIPGISLEEGLRRTLIWYKENQEAQEA